MQSPLSVPGFIYTEKQGNGSFSNCTRMSPRKTRRGAKADGANETLSEAFSRKLSENSPPPSQRTTRTRSQLTKTSSLELEIDRSPEIHKLKRKAGQETPSGKIIKSRKKSVPAINMIGDSLSTLDATASTRKRSRRVKDNETLSEQMIPLDSTNMDESRVKKSRGTRARKKITKKEDSQSKDESGEITTRRKNAKSSTIIATSHEDATINDVGGPMTLEDMEIQQTSARISRFKATAMTPSSPRSTTKRRGRLDKAKIEDFTPESSPITVNLTPHRTTKTPRKSPINLSSPKTHAEQSLRLSKTPRKLPVVESPALSEKSITLSICSTPEKSSQHKDKLLDTSSSSKKKRNLTPTHKSAEKPSRKSPSKDIPVRRFSKSPKIVLRTPKVKSSKLKSPRVVTSKAKISPVRKIFTKSPIKSPVSATKTEIVEKIISSPSPMRAKRSGSPKVKELVSPKKVTRLASPKKVKRVPSPKKTKKSTSPSKVKRSVSPNKSATKMIDSSNSQKVSLHLSKIDSPSFNSPRVSRNSSSEKKSRITDAHKSPTIILKKISPSVLSPGTPTRSLTRRNAAIEDPLKNTPTKAPSAEKRSSQGGESPRRSKSAVKKRIPITGSGTPLRSAASPRGSAIKRSIGKSIIISSSENTPVDLAKGKVGQKAQILSSSTPRERIRRSLNLSPGLGTTSGLSSPYNLTKPTGSSTLVGESRTTRSSRIEDVSNPMISEDESTYSLISEDESTNAGQESRLDETFEIGGKTMMTVEDEQEKVANGTYELAEPKTPTLRSKAGKRSIAEIDTSVEERTAKRTCRVRFASPPLEEKRAVAPVGRSRSATPGQLVGINRTNSAANPLLGETDNKLRRRSSSMTNVSLATTPISGMKRRSNSVSRGHVISASKTAQNASVNRLSKPRLSIQSNKNPEIKTPVVRKAPNFAQIHERKFAKMESLIDAKKRVEKRHLAMNSQIPTSLSRVNTAQRSKPTVSPKSSAPSVAVNGAYNRYGFKLRKNDAMKMVSQKRSARTSEKKQSDNRTLLKGVRTNRRFELIMKARNINH